MLAPEVLGELVNRKALEYSLRPEVVMAIVLQESEGNPWQYRYEPGFFQQYIAAKERPQLTGFVPKEIPSLDSEKRARAMSFGLMQVMGETARSIGKFSNPCLTALCDPEVGVDVGCRVLSYYLREHGGVYRSAVASYNAGSPMSLAGQKYADEIFGRIDRKEYAKYLRG